MVMMLASFPLTRIAPLPRRRPSRLYGRSDSIRSEPSVDLDNGVPLKGPSLAVQVDGLRLPNPFVIASGPPGTNYHVMRTAFEQGWGAVICKTLSLESSFINNVSPRYAQLRSHHDREIMGWENIEIISDRPLETMLEELKRLKEEFPDRVLIASIMEQYKREAWEEIIERVEATGIDGFEINFSCPHGLPEMGMGMAMGQRADILSEVCEWITEKTKKPVWAKMTPNITDITIPARSSLAAGCSGVSAINTISSVMGIDLETLKPQPCVEGYTTQGGYSFKAVKPIALAHVQKCAKLIKDEFNGKKSLSGIGGIEKGSDAAEYLLLGASTVQVCTGVMVHGYRMISKLCGGLQAFMERHGFQSIQDFRGAALPYFTTHAELVKMQTKAKEEKRAQRALVTDSDWTGDKFENEAESMVSN